MSDCHPDVLAYHDEQVTLKEPERQEMRHRRDINRSRLKAGLERDGQPTPRQWKTQGSYAHRTMVQDQSKDYDIDDGVYFKMDDLQGDRGGDKTARDAKAMVRAALHDDHFTKPPEVRKNCVRVYYNAGYHVDVPVYRMRAFFGNDEYFEIASTDWRESDPGAVTRWFNDQNVALSPDTANGRQLRRLTRLIKRFARSRESWKPRIATGFMITTLIGRKCYRPSPHREDAALHETMAALRDRLRDDLEIPHPVVIGEMLTSGPDDGRTGFLRDKLDWALKELDVLFDPQCTRSKALNAWDRVFNTKFFSGRLRDKRADSRTAKAATPAAAILRGDTTGRPSTIDRRGGGRYG